MDEKHRSLAEFAKDMLNHELYCYTCNECDYTFVSLIEEEVENLCCPLCCSPVSEACLDE